MARGHKDDLPDGLSEIFLRKGLDTQIAVELICPSGKSGEHHGPTTGRRKFQIA
jgi:hypothetical protein